MAGSANDAQNVAFLHDDKVFAIELDFGARPFAEQDLVAGLDVQRRDRAILGADTAAGGDDLALLRLFLGGVGYDDAAGRLFSGFDAANEYAVVERAKCNGSGILSLDRDEIVAFTSGEPALPICELAVSN